MGFDRGSHLDCQGFLTGLHLGLVDAGLSLSIFSSPLPYLFPFPFSPPPFFLFFFFLQGRRAQRPEFFLITVITNTGCFFGARSVILGAGRARRPG